MNKSNIIAILHNIRSLHNVGSMFRTADGAGISKLYLTGYTGYPPRPEITKTALGADEFVAWERFGHIGKLIDKLKKKGYLIAAAENGKFCRDGAGPVSTKRYDKFKSRKPVENSRICRNTACRIQNMPWHVPTKPIAFIVGNEVKGLSKNILQKVDVVLEIPMRGEKESLNVSVAFGIIAYYLKQQKMF